MSERTLDVKAARAAISEFRDYMRQMSGDFKRRDEMVMLLHAFVDAYEQPGEEHAGKLPPHPTRAEVDEIFGTDILKAILEGGTVSNARTDDCASGLHEYCTPCECACHKGQAQILDLIKLMPESQTQEIVDFIFSMRAIRGVRPATADTPQDRGALVATLGTLAVMLNACTIYHPSGELAPSFFVTRLKTVADALEATP